MESIAKTMMKIAREGGKGKSRGYSGPIRCVVSSLMFLSIPSLLPIFYSFLFRVPFTHSPVRLFLPFAPAYIRLVLIHFHLRPQNVPEQPSLSFHSNIFARFYSHLFLLLNHLSNQMTSRVILNQVHVEYSRKTQRFSSIWVNEMINYFPSETRRFSEIL